MATKDRDGGGTSSSGGYEQALARYEQALEAMRADKPADAAQAFAEVEAATTDEPELRERARMYRRICDRRTASPEAEPQTVDECFYRAVMLSNAGRPDEAITLFDRALTQDPSSVKTLYARACAWALSGDAERAVSDLRSAISVEPTIRFQAANDPDFEPIREEPSFIDVIEPTPSGV